MAVTSTVDDFTNALSANLQLRAGLAGVTVLVGPPKAAQTMLGEFIMLGNVKATQKWANFASGRYPKDEEYTIDLYIDVVKAYRTDHTQVNARAYALAAEVEQELRRSYQQGVDGIKWCEFTSGDVTKAVNAEDNWRETMIKCGVLVKARLSSV